MNRKGIPLTAATLLLAAGLALLPAGSAYSDSQPAPAPAGAVRIYEIDPANSRVEIFVGRAGLFKAMGHDHTVAARDVSGRVTLDPEALANSSVALRVAAASLTVLDPGESESDRAKVQATMRGSEVLNVDRYPEIRFASTRVTPEGRTPKDQKLTLAGKLSLHGTEREIRFPVALRLDGINLTAEGDAFILQTEYGITPVRVAGGIVKVDDRLRIHFVIHAKVRPA